MIVHSCHIFARRNVWRLPKEGRQAASLTVADRLHVAATRVEKNISGSLVTLCSGPASGTWMRLKNLREIQDRRCPISMVQHHIPLSEDSGISEV